MATGYVIDSNATLVWNQWVGTGSTTITTSANYTQVWANWMGTTSTTLGAYQNIVWTNWEQAEQSQQERDELQARREQRSRERLAEQQRLREDREAASLRAMTLLYDLLTPDERVCFEATDYIVVDGQDGHTYRLETHRDTIHGNIVRVDEHGCVLGRACVAPGMYDEGGALPLADGWVGQLLGLRHDTERFLSHANWSQVYGCREVVAA